MSGIISEVEYQIDLFALFMLLGIGQGIFLSFVFLFKKEQKNNSSLFLGLLVLGIALNILEVFLGYTRYVIHVMYLFSFANSLAFTIGPLLFLYVYSELKGKPKFIWIHFFPFVLYFIYYLLYFNLQSEEFKFNVYIYYCSVDLPALENVIKKNIFSINSLKLQHYYSQIFVFHFCAYVIVSLYLVIKYLRKNSLSFFKTRDAKLKWLRNLIAFFLVLIIIAGYNGFFIKKSTYNYIGATILSSFLYFVSFSYIINSTFLRYKESSESQKFKYSKSSLSNEVKDEILEKIKDVMENEKLYKDNLISLSMLSKKVCETSNHVSQVINECLNQNFYDFLAKYRIDEAKNILKSKDYQNLTIEQVAYEVGYNSKSAFNAAFKKICGKSPSEFRS